MKNSVKIGPFTCYANTDASPGRAILENGTNYERHIVAEINRLAPRSKGFLDVGANVGVHTLNAKVANPLLPIVCAECSPRNLQYLMRNIVGNNLQEVTVLPFPLADRPRIIRTNEHMPNMCCSVDAYPESIGFPRLDAAMSLDHLILPEIDFIKLDVEGFEMLVLRGASKILRTKPTIIFEFCPSITHRGGATPLELLEFFFQMGYTLTILDFRGKGDRTQCGSPQTILDQLEATSVDITDILAEPK